MGRPLYTAELKHQLLTELDDARSAIAQEGRLAQRELRPAALVQRSFAQHRVAWIVGTAVAGLALARLLFPPKIRSDKNSRSDRTRGFFASILSTLTRSLAQRAAMNYAKQHFADQAQQFVGSIRKRAGL